jgi:hypothetical protein
MKQMCSEIKSIKKRDVCTDILQTIIDGPNSILNRHVTLTLPSPRMAVAIAVEILKTVPTSCLRGEGLAEIVSKFTENAIDELKAQQVNIPHTLEQ